MSLEGIFFMSLSMQAIIVSVFFLMLTYFLVRSMREIRAINKKVLEAAEESAELAGKAKEFIGKIGKSVVDYFVIKLLDSVKRKNK